MDREGSNQRRTLNLSVKQGLQYRMIGKVVLILMVSLLISSCIYFFFANREISASFRLFHVRGRDFLDFLLPVVLASFLFSLLAGVLASLFFPSHYAGSLYRIEEDLRAVLKGDLTREILLREGDEYRGLAEMLNQLIASYRDRIALVRTTLSRAQELEGEGFSWVLEVKLEEVETIHRQLLEDLRSLKVAPEEPGEGLRP